MAKLFSSSVALKATSCREVKIVELDFPEHGRSQFVWIKSLFFYGKANRIGNKRKQNEKELHHDTKTQIPKKIKWVQEFSIYSCLTWTSSHSWSLSLSLINSLRLQIIKTLSDEHSAVSSNKRMHMQRMWCCARGMRNQAHQIITEK